MYVCSCFGITEQQVRQHAETGACTPRQIAGACKAGTDCGSCVRKIQALLGRGACPRREALDPVVLTTAAVTTSATAAVAATAVPAPTAAEAA